MPSAPDDSEPGEAALAPNQGMFAEGSRGLLVLAGALLLGEYLIVSHRFDAGPVVQRGGLWKWLGSVGALGPILGNTAAAWYLFFRLSPEPRPARPRSDAPRPVRRLPWLGIHLASATALWLLTASMFGNVEAPAGAAALWMMAWAAVVGLTATSALLMVLGGARWIRVLGRDLGKVLPVGIAAWLGGSVTASLWLEYAGYTLEPAAAVLRFLSVDAKAVPSAFLLHVEHWAMRAAPGCGGYEGFGLFLALGVAYAVRFRRALPPSRALAVGALGLAAIWSTNVLRFAALSLVGNVFGPGAAVASFHSKASWILFAGVSVAIVGAARVPRTVPERRVV